MIVLLPTASWRRASPPVALQPELPNAHLLDYGFLPSPIHPRRYSSSPSTPSEHQRADSTVEVLFSNAGPPPARPIDLHSPASSRIGIIATTAITSEHRCLHSPCAPAGRRRDSHHHPHHHRIRPETGRAFRYRYAPGAECPVGRCVRTDSQLDIHVDTASSCLVDTGGPLRHPGYRRVHRYPVVVPAPGVGRLAPAGARRWGAPHLCLARVPSTLRLPGQFHRRSHRQRHIRRSGSHPYPYRSTEAAAGG